MHSIKLQGITKRFDENTAVNEVCLEVRAHERLVLFGCSGAGKTTLLRLIAGLDRPDCGRILFSNADLTDKPPVDRSVAMVGQDFALYPQLTLQKNLQAGLKRLRLSRTDANERIVSMCEKFQISHLAERLPAQISGGEAQRAAFARALIAEPKILLLDEPLSQMDGLNKEKAIELLDTISTNFNPTTVLVSHDPLDAMRLGDRIAVLHEGKLIDSGTPMELYEKPKTRISGRLLSPFGMNWIDCSLLSGAAIQNRPGEESDWIMRSRYMGFRPEDVSISPSDSGEGEVRLAAELQSRQPLGFSCLIKGNVEGQELRLLGNNLDSIPNRLRIAIPIKLIRWVDE